MPIDEPSVKVEQESMNKPFDQPAPTFPKS